MVKCKECGFLAVRDRETRDLREAEPDFRETGTLPTSIGSKYYLYEETLLCFQNIITFDPRECGSTIGRREQMDLERGDCPGFRPWQRGFTPREHREMLDREHRQVFENELRKEAWEREDLRDEAMRRREDERDSRLESLQTRLHRQELIIIGVGVTIALVLGSIAAAIIEGATSTGWEPSWWPF